MAKPKKNLKNVRLEKNKLDGYNVWRLYHLNDDGTERRDPFFDFFSERLLPGESSADSENTRYNYTLWVAHFLDFLTEAVKYETEQDRPDLNVVILARLIKKYPKFLAEAGESADGLIQEVALRLNAGPCRESSQSSYLGAVNRYLGESEDFKEMMKPLKLNDLNGIPLWSEDDLFPEAVGRIELSSLERAALNRNSMLAGVMAGGAKLRRVAKLRPVKPIISEPEEIDPETLGQRTNDLQDYYDNNHFPFEHIPALIMEGFLSLRNKALFCLLIACGCRLHEALLITWDDVCTRTRTIWLRNPHQKRLSDFRNYFDNKSEVLALPWKGRATSKTFLIEPYKTLFWKLLDEYINSNEYVLTSQHNFVFRTIKRPKGKPLIMTNQSNLTQAMLDACKRIGVRPLGPHSLRHSYGVFCKNFILFDDGQVGMEHTGVQDLMGHKSIESTKRYAVSDRKLQMMRQKVSFAAIFDFKVDSSSEMRLELLKRDYERIRAEIEKEKKLIEEKRLFRKK